MTQYNDEIILVTRDEINQLTDKPISNEIWNQVYERIMSDDSIWQVVDECIKDIVDDVCVDE